MVLKVKGTICPCLVTAQESTTNQALSVLHNLPIQFCTQSNRNDGIANKGVSKFVTNLFRSATNAAAAAVSPSDESSGSGFIAGRLNIIDSIRGPILSFEAESCDGSDTQTKFLEDEDDNDRSSSNEIGENGGHGEKMTIPLRRVGDIDPYDSFITSSNIGIIIYKKKNKRNTTDNEKIELIRFSVRSSNPFDDNEFQSASSEERDRVLEYLRVVIEWERKRQQSHPDEDLEDDRDEDEKRGNGLGQRALKAKYFIQKEVEMKRQMKDRESRKAKYMKDSGGLKYTALAMASREIS